MGNSAASLESRDGWEPWVGVTESEPVGGSHSQGGGGGKGKEATV